MIEDEPVNLNCEVDVSVPRYELCTSNYEVLAYPLDGNVLGK